jgi:hypothetical protein
VVSDRPVTLGPKWERDLAATQRLADDLDLSALPDGYTVRVNLPSYIDVVSPEGRMSVIHNRRGVRGWWLGAEWHESPQAALDTIARRLAGAG